MKKTLIVLLVISMITCMMVLEPVGVNAANYEIYVNQIGYEKTLPKTAVIKSPSSGTTPTQFTLVNTSNGSTAFTGSIASGDWKTMSWYSDRKFAKVDFSSLQIEGRYKVRVIVSGTTYESYPFEIGESILFIKTFPALLDYYYNSRNSGAVWNKDASIPVYNGGTPSVYKDVRGGWYDASGDISKYMSHLQYANFMSPQQTPFVVWQMAYIYDKYSSQLDKIGKKAALASEAAFGADFLMRMKANNPYFYATVFDNWSGDLNQRTICAYSNSTGDKNTNYQCAFREGGGLAIAALGACARLGISGAYSSTDYLNAATSAYAHLKSNNTYYCDNGVENIIDDYCALLAATELYKATNDTAYLNDARTRASNIRNRQNASGWFYADANTRPYFSAVESGLPAVALAYYAAVDTGTVQTDTINAIKNYIGNTVTITGEVNNPFGLSRQVFKYNGNVTKNFFIPRTNETNYWWQGENARIASVASMALLAGRYAWGGGSNIPSTYRNLYVDQLDWILGKNPYGYCMLRGYGSNNPPDYGLVKYGHTDLNGGICNGIHSGSDGGNGIGLITSGDDKWRSVEQWIPHAAWYMLAVSSILDDVNTGGGNNSSNLAFNKTATASSIEGSGFEAAKAFDGNISTRWASVEGSNNEWIYVDLGGVYNINRVKLNWEAAYGKDYKIQVSADSGSPTSWTDVYSTTLGDGGIDDITLNATNARYVRMYGTGRGTAWGYSLWEFEVYGP